uniref:SpoIIIAC/SpoIIIAD family protein n=1 Tax=Agathobacter sp. TaxID=2021311 RepID=UPI003FF13143
MIVKVGLLGITAVFLALILQKEKSEFAMLLVLAAGMILFTYILLRMQTIVSFLSDMLDYLPVDNTYLLPLLKMLGIAYIAEFSSSICKESGYSAIAGQMELFAKLSIVALSIPELMYLMDVLEKYL